ncbi:VapC toxin family PIN domain ribonuclease [filamentous cyanobacterium CCP5]|nr:VapC toxin family PIN domain ribonuclease [filamentous cyanobacterium CCP5]
MYVLDTNTVIYYFKGMGQVAEHMAATNPSELAIPTLVLFELYVGIAKSSNGEKRRQQLGSLLGYIAVLPFTQAMAETAATVRSRLEQRGQPIGPLDGLIAGTALAENATLVTHNTREFARVEGLSLVDWY